MNPDPVKKNNVFRSRNFRRGICGHDWIVENQSDVVEICEMMYSKATANPVRWVLCVHNDSPYQKPEDLEGKLIATEAVNMTKKYFTEKGINVKIEFSWGATEVKCPNLVDAIVELTETGSSLRANNLRIIDTLTTSTTRFIANRKTMQDPAKKDKIEKIAMMLQSVLAAHGKVGLKLNVQKADLDSVLALLPALQRPTVSPLSDAGWFALDTIVSEEQVRDLIPALKRCNASGIVEYPLNKIID